jgi:cobalt-precorrin 5A hydrolase
MKIACVAFTRKGAKLCKRIEVNLNRNDNKCTGFSIDKFSEDNSLEPLKVNLSNWTKEAFEKYEAIIFIGACGIAVRAIAPFLKDKTVDPGVIVVDENANNAISLLSGHIGGANALTLKISEITGALPIISTATDINKKFSVDTWAKNSNMYISNMQIAKEVSSQILDGYKVGVYSNFDIVGNIPDELFIKYEKLKGSNEELKKIDSYRAKNIGICIDINEKIEPFSRTLNLIPKIVSVGIGCRKNTAIENVEEFLLETLNQEKISIYSIKNICSIDLKKNEDALLKLCQKYDFKFETFSAEQLSNLRGNFTPSAFVKEITGVDNVCERAAFIGSNNGEFILKKKCKNSVTIAIAIQKFEVDFK